MAKQKANAPLSLKEVDAKLMGMIKSVIADSEKHTYSMSKVYHAHNSVFKRNDKPQSCPSCLRNRVAELRSWLTKEKQSEPKPATPPAPEAVAGTDYAKALESELAKAGFDSSTPFEDIAPVIDEMIANAKDDAAKAYYESAREQMAADAETEGPAPQYLDPSGEGFVPPAEGVVRYPMGQGDELPIDFTPSEDDELKGVVRYADGGNVKAGTYTAADGSTIKVQVGGKASIVAPDLT